jgi:hypothetical protein
MVGSYCTDRLFSGRKRPEKENNGFQAAIVPMKFNKFLWNYYSGLV